MTPNTLVYNRAGHKARYLSSTPDGHAVKPAVTFWDDDGEERQDYDGIALWDECFLKPPTEVLHEEVAQLNAEIEAAQTELSTLRQTRRQEGADIDARKARLKQHEALARLDDYTAGRITHYLMAGEYGRDLRVITLAQTKLDDYRKGYQMLSLNAETSWGGKVEWRLHQYGDGSGSSDAVVPCCSHEDAVKEGVKRFEVLLAKWRAKDTSYPVVGTGHIARSAKNLGLPVPDDVAASIKAEELKAAQDAVARAEAELEKARTRLNQTIS